MDIDNFDLVNDFVVIIIVVAVCRLFVCSCFGFVHIVNVKLIIESKIRLSF